MVILFNLHFILWLNNIPLYRYTTVGSLSDEYLGSFNLWAIVNNISMNIRIQIFAEHTSSVLLGIYSEVKLPGYMVTLCLTFWEPPNGFQQQLYHFSSHQGGIRAILPQLLVWNFWNFFCNSIWILGLAFQFLQKKKKKLLGFWKNLYWSSQTKLVDVMEFQLSYFMSWKMILLKWCTVNMPANF